MVNSRSGNFGIALFSVVHSFDGKEYTYAIFERVNHFVRLFKGPVSKDVEFLLELDLGLRIKRSVEKVFHRVCGFLS